VLPALAHSAVLAQSTFMISCTAQQCRMCSTAGH
jgi:hypothetical protein